MPFGDFLLWYLADFHYDVWLIFIMPFGGLFNVCFPIAIFR